MNPVITLTPHNTLNVVDNAMTVAVNVTFESHDVCHSHNVAFQCLPQLFPSIVFAQTDAAEYPHLLGASELSVAPTVIVFVNSEIVAQYEGPANVTQLKTFLHDVMEHVASTRD